MKKDFLKACMFMLYAIGVCSGIGSIGGIIIFMDVLKTKNMDDKIVNIAVIIVFVLIHIILCVLCTRSARKLNRKIDALEVIDSRERAKAEKAHAKLNEEIRAKVSELASRGKI